MRILQLCNRVPFPPRDGGALAMWGFNRALQQAGHELCLLALNTRKHWLDPADFPPGVDLRHTPIDTRIRPLQAANSYLFGSLPYNIQRFWSPQHARHLALVLQQFGPDVVLLEGVHLAIYLQVLRAHSPAAVVLRAHNLEYEIWERLAASEPNRLKAHYYNHLARRGKVFEQEALPEFDAVVALSDRDAAAFRSLGYAGPLQVNAPGVNDPGLDEAAWGYPLHIGFLGGLDWLPNLQGLEWLRDHVWPRVLAQQPKARLWVAGRNAPAHVLAWKVPNWTMLGEVESARAFWADKPISLVPLLAGSGLRIKLQEGLMLGKAMLSTRLGAEGLEVEAGTHLLLADSPEDFADGLLWLMNNPDAARAMGLRGRARMLERYTWQASAEQFGQLCEPLTAGMRRHTVANVTS